MFKDFTDKLMSALISCLSSEDEKVRLAAIKNGINLLETIIPKLEDKKRVEMAQDIQEQLIRAMNDSNTMKKRVEGKGE